MAKLVFNGKDEVELPDNSEIKDACEKHGVPMACLEGVCGACIIQVEEGMENLNEMTDAEADFLDEKGNDRLACQCIIKNGTVKIKY